MKIIRSENTSRFIYDKFSEGALAKEDRLLLTNQFHETDQFFILLQQYKLSKEWIIWVSLDLFSKFEIEDVWLIFPESEKAKAENIFAILKNRIGSTFTETSEELFHQRFNSIFDELERASAYNKLVLSAA